MSSLTLRIDLSKWELIPYKNNAGGLGDRYIEYRFLCFSISLWLKEKPAQPK